jgi:uncharacterized caspase-like protein
MSTATSISAYSVLFGGKGMRARLLAAVVLAQAILCQPLLAQQRGGDIRVMNTGADGSRREVRLYEGSYALVIGNSEYSLGWERLSGVKGDIVAVRNVLERHGFKVEIEENLSSQQLERRVTKFINDYGYDRDNRLLIYYAGHGYTLNSTGDTRELGYIIPIDTPLPTRDVRGFRQKAVSMYAIQKFAKDIQAKHALFVFDSCFSGKLFALRNTLKITPFIVEKVDRPVRQFITAGNETQTVPDDSTFRKAFVRGLEGDADRNSDTFITGTELAEYLKEVVTNYTSRRQTPQYGTINDIDLDGGDVVFVTPGSHLVAQSPSQPEPLSGFNVIKDDQGRVYLNPKTNDPSVPRFIIHPPSSFESDWQTTVRERARLLYGYVRVGRFVEGLARVEKEGQWSGFIDPSGKQVIPPRHFTAPTFSEDLVAVYSLAGNSDHPTSGFMDKTGRIVLRTKYWWVDDFSEGLAAVRAKDKYGFMDKTGKTVIKPQYESVARGGFSNGVANVKLNGKWVIIDKGGRELRSLQYYWVGSFSEGLARVFQGESDGQAIGKVRGKYGFINAEGREIVPPKYDRVGDFSEGLAWVELGGKRGFIDKTGSEVIAPKYDAAQYYELASRGDVSSQYGEYHPAEDFTDGLAGVRLYGRYGFVDRSGKEIVPLKYEGVWCLAYAKEGFIGIVLNGKKGFVDLHGIEYFDR